MAIDFGIFDKPVTDYDIFFRFKKAGDWETDGEEKEINNADVAKAKPVTVAIGVDLSALPPFARDTAYLRQNIKLNKESADFRIVNILLADNVDKGDLKKNELDALSKTSHIFVIEVNSLYKPKS